MDIFGFNNNSHKRNKCPIGTRFNSKTNKCESYINNSRFSRTSNKSSSNKSSSNKSSSNKSSSNKSSSSNKKTRNRKSHYRNNSSNYKDTNIINKIKKKIKNNKFSDLKSLKKYNNININDIYIKIYKKLLKDIKNVKNNKDEKKSRKKYLQNKITTLTKKKNNFKKSYSPEINKLLYSLKTKRNKNIIDCNVKLMLNDYTNNKLTKKKKITEPEIKIGKDSKGKIICKPISHKLSKKILINNLRSTKHLDHSKIIMPVQKQANCWFNALFANYFVSDKGRKFFRFFRQLMIEGKKINKNGDKESIKPDNLRYAFGLFNSAIEACYNQGGKNKELALALDTNNIISTIYNSIPNKYIDVYNVNVPGNPTFYYNSIIKFLNAKNVNILEIEGTKKNSLFTSIIDKSKKSKFKKLKYFPELIIIHLPDDNNLKEELPQNFTLSNDRKDVKYSIDSCVVRDINKQHFCSLLTLNKKGYGYDGASFTRLNYFEWKKNLNKDIDWSFQGSVFTNNNKQIYWNFKKSYSMLFYYRVK